MSTAIVAIINRFRYSKNDTGSSGVQIALLTSRINTLQNKHFKVHKKDNHSKRGFLALVSQRRSLLDYLKRSNFSKYKEILSTLGLRR